MNTLSQSSHTSISEGMFLPCPSKTAQVNGSTFERFWNDVQQPGKDRNIYQVCLKTFLCNSGNKGQRIGCFTARCGIVSSPSSRNGTQGLAYSR